MEQFVNESIDAVIYESDDIEPITMQPGLRNYALASIAGLLFSNSEVNPQGHEQHFLSRYWPLLKEETDWSGQLRHYTRTPLESDLSLIKLAEFLQLKPVEVLAVALALAVEEEPMVGRALAHLQAPVSGSRPTLGLLEMACAAFLGIEEGGWVAGTIISGHAVNTGVLSIINTTAPIPEQAFKVTPALSLALQNKHYYWPGTCLITAEEQLTLPDSIKELANAHARTLEQSRGQSVLVLRNAARRESRTIAAHIADHGQRHALFIDPKTIELAGLGPLCVADDLLPVFEYELVPDQRQPIPAVIGYRGPCLVITGPDGHVESRNGSVLNWHVPLPLQAERHQLWRSFIRDKQLAEELACHHLHSTGRIHELADLAQRQALLHNRQHPDREDFRSAGWLGEESDLSSLAQPVKYTIPDDALILTETVEEELQQLVTRCQNRETLARQLGVTIRTRYQTGVRALFLGASGTGKTLAVSWLATRMGLPLYRVDLASVVSKYIGETEANLAKLLARAEQAEIILLFDEADALFGKRTDIKDANDRFANSQTNYLLQRIETYKGIVVLTSNSRSRFDSGFTRRLDKVVEFLPPGPGERRKLWNCHLGEGHELNTGQRNQLAVVSDLVGGYIRNAVLTAAVEAQSENRRIRFDDVITGLASEYRKQGRQLPVELNRARKEFRNRLETEGD